MTVGQGGKKSTLATYLHMAFCASVYLVQLFTEHRVQSNHQEINSLFFIWLLQFGNDCYGYTTSLMDFKELLEIQHTW